ncbi:MAG: LytTR family transcriptional regulator [Eubacterium sp.]|nr:LytTR family transcriptional regulator [Eubacterium sp.]MBQ9022348.1 LytTR family transcriptional regulator [Eubacterium sp.]
MKKIYNLEAASLRILSGYYRNDMAFFSRHANERFLFDIPGHEAEEQTALSIRDLVLFSDDSVKYAVRKAAPSVQTQCGPVCSILMKYTLDRYHNEIPDLQKSCELLICWLNVSTEADQPAWRITLFRICDDETGFEPAAASPGTLRDPSMPRDALVREPRPSYGSIRSDLIRINDKHHIVHILEKDDIIWAESDRLHSVIHTHTGTIRTNITLSHLAEDALSCLYRPHISYLINPRYLYQINKEHLIMTDGMIIPIPERRFAQVKKDLCKAI